MRLCLSVIALALIFTGTRGNAFEDAQVLPNGVRRAELKFFHSIIDTVTNAGGQNLGLGHSLERDVTYNDFIKVRDANEKRELEGFLQASGIDKTESVGSITSDVRGLVNVIAPTFGFGFNDKLSFGLAVPYYSAATDARVAFNPSDNADKFVANLASPEVGLSHKALEAANAINGVTDTLDEKLERSGFSKLGKWSAQGLGDILLKGKYQFFNVGPNRFALDFGTKLPTGRTDDPDVLTDIQFGDGSFDLSTGLMYDFRPAALSSSLPFFINMFAKYTYQAPSLRKIRMKTSDEVIEVPKKNVSYKLGDFADVGTSLQLDTLSGIVGGVGYKYFYKLRDDYDAGESSRFYENNTRQAAHRAEAMIGYSSVNAFQRGNFFMPFTSYLVLERQLRSINLPVQNIIELDFKVYF